MTAHDVLIAAKAMIPDEDHWWRGGADIIRAGRHCECPVTAISRAGRGTSAQGTAEHAFCDAIGDESIPKWNDAPERTLAEVWAAFDIAIEATRP